MLTSQQFTISPYEIREENKYERIAREVRESAMYASGQNKANEIFGTEEKSYCGFGCIRVLQSREKRIYNNTGLEYKLGFYLTQKELLDPELQNIIDFREDLDTPNIFAISICAHNHPNKGKHSDPKQYSNSYLIVDRNRHFFIVEKHSDNPEETLFYNDKKQLIKNTNYYMYPMAKGANKIMKYSDPNDSTQTFISKVWCFDPLYYTKEISSLNVRAINRFASTRIGLKTFLGWPGIF